VFVVLTGWKGPGGYYQGILDRRRVSRPNILYFVTYCFDEKNYYMSLSSGSRKLQKSATQNVMQL
jgi:hypothetical protein